MDLSQEFEDKFEYGDIVLHVDMSFDNILRFHDLLESDHTNEAKVLWGLEALIENYHEIEHLTIEEQYELFKYVMKEFLDQDLDKKPAEGDSAPGKKKEYDFNVDAERIYASFLMDYNLDLFEQQGKLHWKKFMSLLGGLSEKTPFMQVVNIRTMEIPSKDDHKRSFEKNKQKIMKLKRLYELDQNEKNADEVFENMITAFGGRGE